MQLDIPSEFVEFTKKEVHVSVTRLERLGSSPYKADGPYVELKATDVDGLILRNGLQDRFGTLCHQVLEQTLKTGNSDSVTCSLCESSGDNERLLGTARGFARTFLDSPLYRNHVMGHETREELRFYTTMDSLGDVAVEGVIDLVVFGGNTNLVVDYKTDTLKNPDSHKAQILAYVKVAEEIFGKPCLGVLFYLRDGSTGPVWDKSGNCVELPSSL